MSNPDSPFAPPAETPPAAPPASSKGPLWIILAIVGVAIVAPCICGGIFLVFAVGAGMTALAERGNVEPVVETYLQKMEDKDAAGAYAHFSTFAKQQTQVASLEALLEDPNYAVFSGYQDATVTGIRINVTPTRRLANIQGTVAYEDGTSGTFNAVLEREGEEWLIQGINVTVPPSKFVGAKTK